MAANVMHPSDADDGPVRKGAGASVAAADQSSEVNRQHFRAAQPPICASC